MPTRRMIEPAIWQSESMGRLTIRQRLIFIGMFSNADDQGRLRSSAAVIRSMILPFDDVALAEIEDDIHAIERERCIILYAPDGTRYAQIVNWWKYQKHQWAYPSLIPKLDGWNDRLRYKRGKTVITENWHLDLDHSLDQISLDQYSIDQYRVPEGSGEPSPEPLPKGSPEPLPEKKAKSRTDGQTTHDKAISTLMEVFTQYTSIPKPRGTGPKGTLITLWYAPLNRLWSLCGKDMTNSTKIIKGAVEKMRQDKLTISTPKSIESVATSLYGSMKSRENNNGLSFDNLSYQRQVNTPGTAAYRLAHKAEK